MARRVAGGALAAWVVMVLALPLAAADARQQDLVTVSTPGHEHRALPPFDAVNPATDGTYRPHPGQCGTAIPWCDTVPVHLPDHDRIRTSLVVVLSSTRVDLLVYAGGAGDQPPLVVGHRDGPRIVAALDATAADYDLVVVARAAGGAAHPLDVTAQRREDADGAGAFARTGTDLRRGSSAVPSPSGGRSAVPAREVGRSAPSAVRAEQEEVPADGSRAVRPVIGTAVAPAAGERASAWRPALLGAPLLVAALVYAAAMRDRREQRQAGVAEPR